MKITARPITTHGGILLTLFVLMGAVMVAALLLDEVVLELPDLWLTALFWTTVEGVLAGFE